MLNRNLILAVILACSSSACNLIYKQNIQQGNALEQEDLDELYVGMNKRQVLFVLGTPSVQDPFQQNRWDYVQTFSRRGGDLVQRTVTLNFDDDLLTKIIGAENEFGETNSAGTTKSTGTGTSSKTAAAAKPKQDPHALSVESGKEDALEPEIQGLGERTVEERKYEKDSNATNQRAPDDTTSPDIDG
ncbi:MAG: outer membrane protein assembly factor BamE [Xanthomonadales bacterium]|nr:outer membrane protein assembly factor BamE [Xanthomonadales bacterium]